MLKSARANHPTRKLPREQRESQSLRISTRPKNLAGCSVFAFNVSCFESWLQRHPFIQALLKVESFEQIGKALALHIRDRSNQDSNNSNVSEILNKLSNRFQLWMLYELRYDHNFIQYFDPTSLEVIMGLIEPIGANLSSESLRNHARTLYTQQAVFANMEAEALLASQALYPYQDASHSVSPEVFDKFSENICRQASELDTKASNHLVVSGGHGNRDLLNNLSKAQVESMVNHFAQAGIQFASITLECCYSAFHIEAFKPILKQDGIIVCNYLEATTRIYTLMSDNVLGSDEEKCSRKEEFERRDISPGLCFYWQNRRKLFTSKPHETSSVITHGALNFSKERQLAEQNRLKKALRTTDIHHWSSRETFSSQHQLARKKMGFSS